MEATERLRMEPGHSEPQFIDDDQGFDIPVPAPPDTSVAPWSPTTVEHHRAVERLAAALDDDDAVVHSDSTTTTLRAAQTRTVRHDGSLPFARAADVVSLRFRIDPNPPQRR